MVRVLTLGAASAALLLSSGLAFAKPAHKDRAGCCASKQACCTAAQPKPCCAAPKAEKKCTPTAAQPMQCCATKASPMPPCCQTGCEKAGKGAK